MRKSRTTRARGSKTHPATNPNLKFIRSGAFMPSRFRTSLRHTIEWSVLTDGANHYYYLSGNNVKDPGGSLTSTSPPGFNYLSSMYDRYRCYGSKIRADCASGPNANDAVAVAMTGTWVVHPTNTNTAFSAVSNAASQPYAKSKAISTQTPQYITSTMSTSKMTGQKDVLGSDRLQAAISTGPSDEWFWGLNFQSSYNETKTNNLWIRAEVTYDVEFFDLSGTLTPALEKLLSAIYTVRCADLKEQKERVSQRDGLHWQAREPEPEYVLPPTPSLSRVRDDKKESVDSQFSQALKSYPSQRK